MDKKTKKRLLEQISKATDDEMVEILKFIREEGDTDFLVPLAGVLVRSDNEVVKNEIKNLFLEVKRSAAPKEIIGILSGSEFEKEKKFFTELTWQLNLDFSPYLNELLDFFIEYEDLEMALDMFSAIEAVLGTYATKFKKEELDDLQRKLKDNIHKFEHSKKLLSVQLSHLFDEAKTKSTLGNIDELNFE